MGSLFFCVEKDLFVNFLIVSEKSAKISKFLNSLLSYSKTMTKLEFFTNNTNQYYWKNEFLVEMKRVEKCFVVFTL